MTNLIPALDAYSLPSPSALVADMKAGGWQYIGVYPYDDDIKAPWTNAPGVTSEHVSALHESELTPFPIVTQNSATTATGDILLSALHACGFTSGVVAFDLEDTATPFVSLVEEELGALNLAGFYADLAYLWPPYTWLPVYGPLFQFKWAGGQNSSVIPSQFHASQYSKWRGPSGFSYDVDVFQNGILNRDPIIPVRKPSSLTLLG